MAVITYKCPNCGGDLRFHPESQKYRCEYCRSEFTPQEAEEKQEAGHLEEPQQEAVLYNCPSCGAEIVTDENTAATFCYYCHNPVVLEGRMQGSFHPDYVLPFVIDRDKALEIFHQWMRKKRFVPKAFYSKDQLEKVTGVYFPYWLYSCQVDGKLTGTGTKNRVWNNGNMQYVETSKFDINREGHMPVEHVTRNALSKANRQLVEGVFPFEMEKLTPFRMGYLSGFMAEKRDMEKDVFVQEIQQEVKSFADTQLKSELSLYDSVQVQVQNAQVQNEKWEYAMLPVWTLTYKSPTNNKIYYFACNGQTGKICGELPVDRVKLIGVFAAVFVPLFVTLLLVGYFL